ADLTLHDCAAQSNTATWPFLSNMAKADQQKCEGQPEKCKMVPYKDGCGQSKAEKKKLRKAGEAHKILTPHHLVPDHCAKSVAKKAGKEKYKHGNAPCICATGRSWNSVHPTTNQPLKHNRYHRRIDVAEAKSVLTSTKADLSAAAKPGAIKSQSTWPYKDAKEAGMDAAKEIDGCAKACIEAQLRSY